MAVAILETGRRVLLTGLEERARVRVAGSLAPYRHDLTDVPDAPLALELARAARFDALVVSHPVPGRATSWFLREVRAADSPCRSAGLVLVTPRERAQEAATFVGQGANRVVAVEEVEERLADVLGPLFRVPRRFPLRAAARVEVCGGARKPRVTGETMNVSTSGMLLRLPYSVAPGTELGFDLYLPGVSDPLVGHAVVVRQTTQRESCYPGVGAAFIGFERDGLDRLHGRLSRLDA